MVRKSLILSVFDAAYMQRWNDKLRPIDLIELDKQAHKVFIAYFLGKFEESRAKVDWTEIIEYCIFGLLQRLVITDIKPPVFYIIKADSEKYRQLNRFVFSKLKSKISPLGSPFVRRFKQFLFSPVDNINSRIVNAAHSYASKWEFNILESLNKEDYEINLIKKHFQTTIESYNDLYGMQQIGLNENYKRLIDMCGKLRFQARWGHLYRIPRTSVLSHSLFVAILGYMFSLQLGACHKRLYNNFFCGLFHDLPEVLTRDIISPVKTSIEGLEELIKAIESAYAEKNLYPLIPPLMLDEIKSFMQNEFANFVTFDGKRKVLKKIPRKFNKDEFDPRDGSLIKASDDLAAFIEASAALQNGCSNSEFQRVVINIKTRYEKESPIVSGINFSELYADL